MLRYTAAVCGRWNPRDFLRGRTKKGGAIHTRHTHGKKGRYKRLSSRFGLRDGRRHSSNHMQGGLGVKVGGGLFGLRIPRQHMLSTMSRDEYELMMYGHPHITNPYCEHMETHPDLKRVMANAFVNLHLVVLLPRVRRQKIQFDVALATHTVPEFVPPQWLPVVEQVSGSLRHVGDDGTRAGDTSQSGEMGGIVYLTTLEASVQCPAHAGTSEMRAALAKLYDYHTHGRVLRPEKNETHSQPPRVRRASTLRAPFMSSALLNPAGSVASTGRYTSAAFALVRSLREEKHEGSVPPRRLLEKGPPSPSSASEPLTRTPAPGVLAEGAQAVVRQLRHSDPNALCFCMRPLLHYNQSIEGSTARVGDTTITDASSSPPNSPSVCSRTAGEACATQVPRERHLLKTDLDPDGQIGVWNKAPCTVNDLLRWHYSHNDPRAHSSDALSHEKRRLSVHIFVDASKSTNALRAERVHPAVAPSLLSEHFSGELIALNYRLVSETSLPEVFMKLHRWSRDYHWVRAGRVHGESIQEDSQHVAPEGCSSATTV